MIEKKLIYKKVLEIEHEIALNLSHVDEIGLFDGLAGIILFYSYLNLYSPSKTYSNKINEVLLRIFHSLNNPNKEQVPLPSVCSGLAGIIWVLNHVTKEKGQKVNYDLDQVMPFLKKKLKQHSEMGDFDFLHGAGGIAISLLETNNIDNLTLNTFLQSLNINSKSTNIGKCWKANKYTSGERTYNLGLAHGLPSTVIILISILDEFPKNKLAKELLEEYICFILNNKKIKNNKYLFPNFINEDLTQDTKASRLGWCYGDLGNSMALWSAGTVMGRKDWTDTSIEIMLHATKRKSLHLNGLKDASFCHGTSGVAHYFNHFYKKTKIPEFNEARWFWTNKTLQMSKWPDGVAGYKYLKKPNNYIDDYSLISGVAGIGLSLLGILDDNIEGISWDKFLLFRSN